MKYYLFYRGLASTPYAVGLMCQTTNEVVCEISTDMPRGKDCRAKYEKFMGILKNKYSDLVN